MATAKVVGNIMSKKKSKLANGKPTGYTPPSTPPHSRFTIAPRNLPEPPTRRSIDNGFGTIINEKLKSHDRKKQDFRVRKTYPATVNSSETISKQDQSDGDRSPTAVLEALIRSISLAVVTAAGIIDKQVGGDESEVQSMGNMAAEELFIRPKFGETYEAVTVDVERIKKRVKDLSMSCGEGETANKSTIDEGLEISDAVSLLKLQRISSSEIEMAGQKAQRAATLMLQAQMMTNKANELLAQSKQILQSADL